MGKDGCKQRNVASLIECTRSFTSRNAIQNKENPVTGVMRAKAREERLSHLEDRAISSKNRTQFIFGEIGQWRRRCRIQNHTCVAISETGFRERSLIQKPVGRRDVIHKHIHVDGLGVTRGSTRRTDCFRVSLSSLIWMKDPTSTEKECYDEYVPRHSELEERSSAS